MTRLLKLVDQSAFRSFDLDDGIVIFDRRSGYTYLLDSLSSFVFEVLAEKPCTTDDLVHIAASMYEPRSGNFDGLEDLEHNLDVATESLMQLEVVQRV